MNRINIIQNTDWTEHRKFIEPLIKKALGMAKSHPNEHAWQLYLKLDEISKMKISTKEKNLWTTAIVRTCRLYGVQDKQGKRIRNEISNAIQSQVPEEAIKIFWELQSRTPFSKKPIDMIETISRNKPSMKRKIELEFWKQIAMTTEDQKVLKEEWKAKQKNMRNRDSRIEKSYIGEPIKLRPTSKDKEEAYVYAPKHERRLTQKGHEVLDTGINVNQGALANPTYYDDWYRMTRDVTFTDRELRIRHTSRQMIQERQEKKIQKYDRYPYTYKKTKEKDKDGKFIYKKVRMEDPRRQRLDDFVNADKWDFPERTQRRNLLYKADPNDPYQDGDFEEDSSGEYERKF